MVKTNKQVVIYARVSTKEQEREGFSIPAQLKFLREYAANNNLTVIKEFTESETGGKAGRTNFNKMVKLLIQKASAPNPCKTILVEKTDRLYRNFKDYVTLDELDLEIHFVKENQILSKDSRSNEKFIHGIKVLMAKNYIDNLSEEVQKGMLEKAEQGIYPSRAPFGYKNVRVNDKSIIEVEPDDSKVVKEMFQMYSSGQNSLNEIKEELEKKKIKLSSNAKGVNTSAIRKILGNSFYTGRFYWKDKLYMGTHDPIISYQLFQKTEQMLKNRGRSSSRKHKTKKLFQGFIECAKCGRILVPDEKKKKYVYYHCKAGVNKKNNQCDNSKYVRESELEKQFKKHLEYLKLSDSLLNLLVHALKSSHEDEKEYHIRNLNRLRNEYEKYTDRLSKLYDDKLDGTITKEFFLEKQEEYKLRQQDIKQEIQEHEDADKNYIELGIQLVEILQSTLKLYDKATIEQKRKIINFIGSNFSYENGKLDIEFRQPFNIIIDTNMKFGTKKAANCDVSGESPLWWAQEESNL